MTNLLDVTPSVVTIKVVSLGKDINVPGLSIEGMARLLSDNPQVAAIFEGKGIQADGMQAMINLGSKFIAEFLAAGLGYPGDEKAIDMCRKMPPGDVWDIGEKILDVSFPGGAKSFLAKVMTASDKLAGTVQVSGAEKPQIKSIKKNPGKAKEDSLSQLPKAASS